ncbi:receptor-type adenylate cyclase a-like protein [Leishmania tarentolae]|uniref:adenylate cyclase n=1 Tax=Leishmania tarentolae TaxID=5689 RepID=A0A640L0T1_LEITA|nr:receptor-type adenylate cyclase a-like protein [Leishmania tarentolae]
MWQSLQLVMSHGKGSRTHPSGTPVVLLLLLLLCAPVSAQKDNINNAFDVECVLLHTTDSSETAMNAADATAKKASITCSRESLTNPSAWVPTDGSDGKLNVYMSMLPDKLLSSVVAAASSTRCTLVTSISEGVLDTRTSSRNVYFTNADPATEMLAVMSYVLIQKNPSSIGLVYMSSEAGEASVGSVVYKEFSKRISGLGYAGTILTYDALVGYNSVMFADFLKNLGGVAAVLFFVPAGRNANSMFADLLMTSPEVTLLIPSWLISTATSQYLAAVSPKVPASNIIVSSTNPHPDDTNFQASMTEFKNAYGSTAPSLAFSSADGIQAVAGWLTARATVATLQLHTLWTESPAQEHYFNGLQRQHVYTIGDDIVLGEYSSSCNVGGRMVLLYALEKMKAGDPDAYYGLISVPDANLMLKPWECRADDVVLNISKMVRAAYVMYQNSGANANYMTMQMDNMIPAAMLSASFTKTTIGPLESLDAASWKTALDSSPAVVVFGSSSVGVDKATVEKILLEPVFLQPTLYQNASNVVYLTATNEQQLGALAAWMSTSATSLNIYAVLRISDVSETAMERTLLRIMTYFNMPVKSIKTLSFSDTLSSSDLPTDGFVLLTGMIKSDIDTLTKHMQRNTAVRVILLFDEVTQWYNEIKDAFTPIASAGERLLFATNLPPWVRKKRDLSTFSEEFLNTAIGPEYHSPASMRGYLAVRVLSMLSNDAKSPSISALLETLYTKQVLQVNDLTLGPFQGTGCMYSTSSKKIKCASVLNGGACEIYIWSYSRMVSEVSTSISGPYVINLFGYLDDHFDSSTPGDGHNSTVNSTKEPEVITPESSESTIIIVVIVCVVVFAALAAVAIVYVVCAHDSRDNHNAPKEENEPVTLIFTDVENSTALWATVPLVMTSAMTLHHKLIRQLIIKYKCYEVKTIGDSFMIACKQPFNAVQLARDIQIELRQADWGSTVIDDTYASIKKPTGGTSTGEGEVSPWKGLRVRAGVHRGLVEVRFDDVTKGYDYYGNVVNTAARTEGISCGGQVICTSSVVEALTEEELSTVQFVSLGPHQLRGVAEPIEMYELRTVPGRVFPHNERSVNANPLASLAEDADVNADDNINLDINGILMQNTLSETAANVEPVVEVLDVYLSAYTIQQKIKILQRTCKSFCLPRPPRQMFASNEAYLDFLMLAVAMRTSAVINFRHKQLESGTLRSAAKAQDNAPVLEVVSYGDVPTEPRRRSSVFFSGVESPVAGEWKRQRSIMMDHSGENQSKNDNEEKSRTLVLGNDESLTVCSNTEVSFAEKCLESDLEAPMVYQNGSPSISGDEVRPCFESGNGLLFRVIDKATKRWAFYNDTVDCAMHIYFSVGRTSAVKWGPAVAGKVTQVESTGRYEGELIVAPLVTEVLMTGRVNGYTMRYCATPFGDAE